MTLVGIRDVSSGRRATNAARRGFAVYATPAVSHGLPASAIPVHARLDDLLEQIDVVVDCAPAGTAAKILKRYGAAGVRAVLQTGGTQAAAAPPFLAEVNYESVVGLPATRVVSSDTAAVVRTLGVLRRAGLLARASGTLAGRCGRCANALGRRVSDARIRTLARARDAQELAPDLNVTLAEADAPHARCHLHSWRVELARRSTPDAVLGALCAAPRVVVARMCDGILAELMCDVGCLDGELGSVVVWEDLLAVQGHEAFFACQVFDEGTVVRENIDAIRALTGTVRDGAESMRLTDEALGTGPAFLSPSADREAARRRQGSRLLRGSTSSAAGAGPRPAIA